MKLKSTSSLCRLSLAGLCCLAAPLAQAQPIEGSYGYFGIGGGPTRGKFGSEAEVTGGLATGATLTGFTRDSRDTGYKIIFGYQYNRNFALEGGYFDLGKPSFSATTSPAGTATGRFKLNGVNLDLVGTLPLSDNWSVLGRVGLAAGRVRATFDTTGPVTLADVSQRKTNAKVGVGLQYALGTTALIRAELENYRMNDAVGSHVNVNQASVSVVFPFGVSSPARPVVQMPMAAPAPAPMVAMPPPPPPAPAPIIVVQAPPAPVAPAPAPRRRVTFSAESLFGFDRSEVNATGQAALDTFARELDGTQFEMVVVEGHTDRMGSLAYNQNLSLQRADAVKSYLVTHGRVDPTKISSVGKGESSPTTKPGDCAGGKSTAQLIICLQPDRRVDVDVVGTR